MHPVFQKIQIALALLLAGVILGFSLAGCAPPTPPPPSSPSPLRVNPVDGAEMILIPGGPAPAGGEPGPYYIYRFEVSNSQFEAFVKATGYRPQGEWSLLFNDFTGSHPVCEVSYADAQAYARWAGGDLPTDAQWELAARGRDGRKYPWGDTWNPDLCNNREMKVLREKVARLEKIDGLWHGTLPAGSFPGGASPFGVMDMAGSVAEWCRDGYKDENGQDTGERSLRGGSFLDGEDQVRLPAKDGEDPEKWCNLYGFRVVVPPGKTD